MSEARTRPSRIAPIDLSAHTRSCVNGSRLLDIAPRLRCRVASHGWSLINGEIIADLLLAGQVLLRGLWSDGLQKRSSSLPKFPAIAHVALTVSDLDRSRKWYQRLFGSDPVLDQDTGPFHQVVWSVSGALVAINGFPDLHSSEPFDERRPGLDHLAFACSSQSELEAWERRLNELDVPNGGVVDASYGSVLSFRDPDNIALEFFASLG
jgi:glyoxylase I family protein